jgi:GNAT superfamily N-acetyltransferase
MGATSTRVIRRARIGDSDHLGPLTERSSSHWGYPPDFFDWAPGASNVSPDYITGNPVYVLEEDGRVVGYYGFTKESDDLLLDKLFVDRDWIGTGCGKLLWLHAVNTARDLGYQHMIIGSDPNAASFYQAMGAVWYAEKPTPSPDWTVQMFRYTIPPLVIRRATPDEAPVLHDLTGRSALHWGYEPEFLLWEPEAIAVTPEFIRNSETFVMEEGDRLVGYYSLVGELPDLSLDKLFVEPGRIGTGFGKRLWLHAVGMARELGASELTFMADPNAAPFYRAMGAEWLREEDTTRPGWNLQLFRYSLSDHS